MTMPLLDAPLGLRIARLHIPAEREAIEAFVAAHPDATPFHLPAWSMAIELGCGQPAHYLVAARGGGLVGVLPLTAMSSPLFGKALVSAGFGVGGGPLVSEPAAASALADAAWALAQKLRCPSVELRGGAAPGEGWTSDDTTYLGFARPLAADEAGELAAIPRKQRAEVRKALDSSLTVTTGRDARDAKAHFRVYAESVRNLGTPVFPPRLFRAMLDRFGDAADILTVWDGDRPVASVLSLYAFGTVYPYWGGGTWAARSLRANDFMYFRLMQHARERGCMRFDFGRSKAGTGPAAFKKNWGFEGTPRTYFQRTAAGVARREINPMNPRYRMQVALWKKLPLWVANRAGPLIARGLG